MKCHYVIQPNSYRLAFFFFKFSDSVHAYGSFLVFIVTILSLGYGMSNVVHNLNKYYSNHTERCSGMINAPASYSGGPCSILSQDTGHPDWLSSVILG
jgi:hypothetical protein